MVGIYVIIVLVFQIFNMSDISIFKRWKNYVNTYLIEQRKGVDVLPSPILVFWL